MRVLDVVGGARPIVRLIVACASVLVLCESQAFGQPCRSISSDEHVTRAGVIRSDGKINLTYKATGGSEATLAAIQAAADEWNAHSSSSKVVLQHCPWCGVPDLELVPSNNPDHTSACASYRGSTSRVFFSPALQEVAASNPAGATIVFGHEMGALPGAGRRGIRRCVDYA